MECTGLPLRKPISGILISRQDAPKQSLDEHEVQAALKCSRLSTPGLSTILTLFHTGSIPLLASSSLPSTASLNPPRANGCCVTANMTRTAGQYPRGPCSTFEKIGSHTGSSPTSEGGSRLKFKAEGAYTWAAGAYTHPSLAERAARLGIRAAYAVHYRPMVLGAMMPWCAVPQPRDMQRIHRP